MTEGGNQVLGPEEQLVRLVGSSEQSVKEGIDVLRAVTSVQGLIREFQVRHYTCDEEQFLLPMFRSLYQADEAVRESVQVQLSGTGASRQLIEQYLVDSGDQPYLYFRLAGILDDEEEVRDRLIEQAPQVMLDALRVYLGFQAPVQHS